MEKIKNESVAKTTAKADSRSHKKANPRKDASESFKKICANSSKDSQPSLTMIESKIDTFFDANKELGIRKLVSAAKLMEAGAHIGTPLRLWNPKMRPFVYPRRNRNNQIIDLLKSLVFMDRACNFLKEIVKSGGKILMVGTKGNLIKEHIKNEATRANAFYVNQRWLGGSLTNFKTLSKSIDKLNNLINLQTTGEIKKYAKKEQLEISKKVEKMTKFIGGIRTMRSMPQALFVTDIIAEKNAIIEARKLRIPVIALANTNANPDLIDFIIPINTASPRAVWLVVSIITDAICEAMNLPTLIINKKDEEIILPEVARKNTDEPMVNVKQNEPIIEKAKESTSEQN